ncbi:beta-lactamase/transpeptidase-like protein [Mycena alexandri]|uniref:Beta-lactamase/transpeptidase-like protein n=1 Tax=Mycena alexandri TaxID=1745969 RepID=A0AAD6T747_9AGAR|nr:beta-lactamase/transpeptidase-like protein [Mycena alexandri]
MFTVLETLVLRERGILNWDDPVSKFIPKFATPSYGWSDFLDGNEYTPDHSPITLRQLASHLSGIGRDYPPYDVGETWPGPVKNGGTGNETLEELLAAYRKISSRWHLNTLSRFIPTLE